MKWASWTNVVLGLWLIVAPFALAYSGVTTAVYEDVILGIVIAALALWQAVGAQTPLMASASWIVATGGLWVLVAPFLLGYSNTTAAVYNDVIVGLVVLILGLWRALSRGQGEMPHMAAHH
ncbi:MAG: SPW repeat protein [Candidatus Methylomirabilia bacterium]